MPLEETVSVRAYSHKSARKASSLSCQTLNSHRYKNAVRREISETKQTIKALVGLKMSIYHPIVIQKFERLNLPLDLTFLGHIVLI